MLLTFLQTPIFDLAARFTVDIIAVLLMVFGMYYRRHHDKELVTTTAMFNFAVFSVLIILSSVQFGVAVGFGLFAILALFRLRSEQFDKIEISYFFGTVAIGVICAIQGTARCHRRRISAHRRLCDGSSARASVRGRSENHAGQDRQSRAV